VLTILLVAVRGSRLSCTYSQVRNVAQPLAVPPRGVQWGAVTKDRYVVLMLAVLQAQARHVA
jgi:hypothetical protein